MIPTTTRREKKRLQRTALSEASKCSQENARDPRVSRRRFSWMPGAQGWRPISPLPSRGRRATCRLHLCAATDRTICRRPDFAFQQTKNISQRSKTMKRAFFNSWQWGFVRAVALVVLIAVLPLSVLRAATEAARVVKYSKEDIVPVRAKLRFSTLIVLPEDEEILDFTTGDKEFWI